MGPQKSLLARAAGRIAEALSPHASAGSALVLFAVSAFITSRLFGIAYLRNMASIEGAFIGLARYIRDHFPHLTWFPLWYGGIPFADAYPPLVHVMVAGVSAATGASPGRAYHVVVATAYALGPVTLFWAAMQLGARRVPAFLAALGYSLISPSCWMVPQIRVETSGWFGPRRLLAMVTYGEGPHIASLVLLPLALGLTHRALASRKPLHFILAGLAMAATALCNWIGALALALALAAYLLSGYGKYWKPVWRRTIAIGIYSYAIALPWASPSTISTIRVNAPKLVGFRASGWRFGLFLLSLPALAWCLKRLHLPPMLRFPVLLFYGPAALALTSYWFHTDLLPQANRYHLEMDLAFWMAVALVTSFPFSKAGIRQPGWLLPSFRWPRNPRNLWAGQSWLQPAFSRFLGARNSRTSRLTGGVGQDWLSGKAVWIALTVLVAFPLIRYEHRRARDIESPIDIRSTAEFEISHWLGEHLPGRRVFAPGSVSFWMTTFSDTPMLVGGFDNGIRNQLLWDVNFQILFGAKPEIAVAWLKALGCDAIIGNDPDSREVYHSYAHPDRLHGLPELWRDGPEVIYAVPRRGSLAHVIRAENLVQEVPTSYDPKALAPYFAALDDPSLPVASFRWRDPAAASITADLSLEELLSIQVAWDQGWTARIDGEPRRIWGDKLGQIVVEPLCAGRCTVELTYDGGLELALARWSSVLALAAGAVWIGLAQIVWHKPSDSTMTS